jgi:hypothetical protein
LVTGKVLGRVLPFAILEIRGLHDNARAVLTGTLAVRRNVLDPYHHRVRHLARARGPTITSYVTNDDGSVAEPQLGPVILTDAQPLLKTKSPT